MPSLRRGLNITDMKRTPRSSYSKGTDAQIEKRILDSAEYVSAYDPTRKQFTFWFLETFPEVKSESQAHKYWKLGWERCTKIRENKIVDRRTKRIIQLEHQYEALKKDDPKAAAQVLMMIAKLEGLEVRAQDREANDKFEADKPIFTVYKDKKDKTA
jgi:hypothetical protein